MPTVFVFPGQGAQSVGMGRELYENNAAARAVFDEVDDALNQKLSDIIFNGPMDELTLTSNVQPAIMATSIAMLRASGASVPEYVAGHSLGEYTALCASGAISLSDTARLLRARGDAMQAAAPVGSGLTAVVLGLDVPTLNELCVGKNCNVANDNCPGQVVVSGARADVEAVLEMAKTVGARRAMPLALSVPVHCAMQASASEKMRAALESVEIKTPSAKFISNKTADVMTNTEEIRDSLVYQMTHGVRWRESVLRMAEIGITDMIEVGPGNVLTGLATRITDKINAKKLEV